MSLSADPSISYQAHGNALSSQALAASASVSFTVDYSSNSLGGEVQVVDTGGASVAATNGLQVSIFAAGDNTPRYETIARWSYVIPTTASTVTPQGIFLPTGKYSITLKNLDATNAITVEATSNPAT